MRMPDHPAEIPDELVTLEQAGIRTTCWRSGNEWTLTAVDGDGHTWQVTADTALQAITELMEKLEFADLDSCL